MTSPEFDKLAVLLRTLCPNAPEEITITGDKKTALAYFYALSPYTYEQAKAGALAAIRKSRLYPSVAEIVAGIPSPPASEAEPPSRRGSAAEASWMRPYIQRTAEKAKNSPSRIQREGVRKEAGT